MQSVTHPTIRAKYAHIAGEAVTLIKVQDDLWVLYEGSRLERFTADQAVHTVVLGDVNLADSQHLADMLAGGYAAVACGRLQEVA